MSSKERWSYDIPNFQQCSLIRKRSKVRVTEKMFKFEEATAIAVALETILPHGWLFKYYL